MRVGVIASLKKGLDHFLYRELLTFTAQQLSVTLFATKYQLGLYNPRKEWKLCLWRPLTVVLLQPYFFLRAPIRYTRLLFEALTYRALVHVALAWYFSRNMADVDVIYATFGDQKLFVGYFCKQIMHKPLVVTIHAYELFQNPNPRLFVRALQACDQVITVTDYNRELLTSRYQIAASKIAVVRISVNVEDYKPENKFIVLIVSFFLERKGHEILLRAIKQLAQNDVEVWVVGDEGAERETPVDVRRMAADLGIESQVAFFGALSGNALRAAYRQCDVFCLPCRKDSAGLSEGFPTVLAEAMAFGKPVITTRHVEIPRVIDEILVEENDVDGLARALRQVYESPALRQRLGERNRRLAEEVFSTRNAERSARIMCEVAERHRGS